MEVELPQIRTRRKVERVLDARLCVINQCRFMQTGTDRSTGAVEHSCGAGVYRAQLPAGALHDEVRRNPNPAAGSEAEQNPFLLRLLMATECLRPECGVAEIAYSERSLDIDQAEIDSGLFS